MRIDVSDTFDPDRQFESDTREQVFRGICTRLGAAVWSDREDAPNAVTDVFSSEPRPLRISPVDSAHDSVAIRSTVVERLAELNGSVVVTPIDKDRKTTTDPVVAEAVETVETADPVRYDSADAATDPVDDESPEPDDLVFLIDV